MGAAIEALGFSPSPVARSLNLGRTQTVGALVPTNDHSIYARFSNALEDALSRRGPGLLVAVTGGCLETEAKKTQGLLRIGVDGSIVSGVARHPHLHQIVERARVPFVSTSIFDGAARTPTIGYDNASIVRRVADFLRSKGHRLSSVIHGSAQDRDQIEAGVAGATSAGGDAHVALFEASVSVKGGAEAMGRILRVKDRMGGRRKPFCACPMFRSWGPFSKRSAAVWRSLAICRPWDLTTESGGRRAIQALLFWSCPRWKRASPQGGAMVNQLVQGTPIPSLELKAHIIERGSAHDANVGP